jgi:hypothetical protein
MRWVQNRQDLDFISSGGFVLGWINGDTAVVAAADTTCNHDRRRFDNIYEAKAWLEYACTFWEMTKEMPPEGEWEWDGQTM